VLTAFSGEIFGVDPVTGNQPISFEWIPLISIVINIVTGYIACLIFGSFTKSTSLPA
jgi:hypothetical protein